MALNLIETVSSFLKSNPDNQFTARQISEWIYKTYPEECRQKQERSKAEVIPLDTESGLLQQLVAEIGSQNQRLQKKYPQIKTTEGRPRKYYFTSKTEQDELNAAETSDTLAIVTPEVTTQLSEHSLYPLLSEYLLKELGVYSKRIDEKRSSNTRGVNGNKWLYPDLVGMENLSEDWHEEIKNCVKQYADRKTKLWSFEVKRVINSTNVREVFFQTVSNSTWANLGYLVAAQITGKDIMKELRMLSSLHGIGIIRFDAENPSESEVLIPARERSEVDWNSASRLAHENRDFLNYVKLVRQFYQTNDPREKDWDYYTE